MNDASPSSMVLYLQWFWPSATLEDQVLHTSPLKGDTLHGLFFLTQTASLLVNFNGWSFTWRVTKFPSVQLNHNWENQMRGFNLILSTL